MGLVDHYIILSTRAEAPPAILRDRELRPFAKTRGQD